MYYPPAFSFFPTPLFDRRKFDGEKETGEKETGEELRLCPYCTGGRLGHTL